MRNHCSHSIAICLAVAAACTLASAPALATPASVELSSSSIPISTPFPGLRATPPGAGPASPQDAARVVAARPGTGNGTLGGGPGGRSSK